MLILQATCVRGLGEEAEKEGPVKPPRDTHSGFSNFSIKSAAPSTGHMHHSRTSALRAVLALLPEDPAPGSLHMQCYAISPSTPSSPHKLAAPLPSLPLPTSVSSLDRLFKLSEKDDMNSNVLIGLLQG